MSEVSVVTDGLKKEIRKAFADTDYPGDAFILYRRQDQHLEVYEYAEMFRNHDWEELQGERLVANPDAIFYLSAKAFLYFLPAYLCVFAENLPKSRQLFQNFIFTFTSCPPWGEKPTRTSLLCNDQRRVVISIITEYVRRLPHGDHLISEASTVVQLLQSH